jgi:large subunit ribosomal protein L28
MPEKYRERAPRTVKLADGRDALVLEGQPPYPAPFLDLRAGRTNATWLPLPAARSSWGSLDSVSEHAIKGGLNRQTTETTRTRMAQRCDICGKGPAVGHKISHAHNVTKRRWLANLVSLRGLVKGKVQRMRVCTRCLKAGKVVKVV